jgi:spore cortex formation protein SpoVR/YcgB (stage V sporulation)
VLGAVGDIVQYGRPDDYVQTLKQHTEAVSQSSAQSAIAEIVKPQALTWVIVGDLKKIEKPVRALDLGEVHVIDADGKPVAAGSAAKAKAGK